MQNGPFSYLHKAGVSLALCIHLRDIELSLGEAEEWGRERVVGI